MNSRTIHNIFSNINASDSFIYESLSYGDLLKTAAGYIETFQTLPRGKAVCIATEKRELVLASFIAALFSDIFLILPFSISQSALQDVHENTSFQYYIGDRITSFDSDAEFIEEQTGDFTLNQYTPKNNDEIIMKLFTGGSTGKPKIWSKTPGALIGECLYHAKEFSINSGDLFLSAVPPYHIYGFFFSLLIPFLGGASIIGETLVYPNAIKNVLSTVPVTVYVSVPAQYKVINKYQEIENSLRLAFSSAGPLREEEAVGFNTMTDTPLYEVYGSTETGGIALRCRAHGENFFRPFKAITCRFINDRLAVSSPYLSTEIELDEEGFFLTNDAAEEVDNGFVTKGRIDSIVKVGGKRIDLNMIQEKLNDLPEVKDSIVISLPRKGNREIEVVAAVVTDEEIDTIKTSLGSHMVSYAIPKRMKKVDSIPYKASGKINTEALVALFTKGV